MDEGEDTLVEFGVGQLEITERVFDEPVRPLGIRSDQRDELDVGEVDDPLGRTHPRHQRGVMIASRRLRRKPRFELPWAAMSYASRGLAVDGKTRESREEGAG